MILLDLIISLTVVLWKYFLHHKNFSPNNCCSLWKDPALNACLTQNKPKKTFRYFWQHPIYFQAPSPPNWAVFQGCLGFFFKHLTLIISLINPVPYLPSHRGCHTTDDFLNQYESFQELQLSYFQSFAASYWGHPAPFRARIPCWLCNSEEVDWP